MKVLDFWANKVERVWSGHDWIRTEDTGDTDDIFWHYLWHKEGCEWWCNWYNVLFLKYILCIEISAMHNTLRIAGVAPCYSNGWVKAIKIRRSQQILVKILLLLEFCY